MNIRLIIKKDGIKRVAIEEDITIRDFIEYMKQTFNDYEDYVITINQQRPTTTVARNAMVGVSKENIDKFEKFRVEYPGVKRGLETEFELFRRHDDWKECIDYLYPALQAKITERKTLEEKKKFDATVFIPEWQHLKTYLNQRSWEGYEEYFSRQKPLTEEQQRIKFMSEKYRDLPERSDR